MNNHTDILTSLKEFIAIESVSGDSKRFPSIAEAGGFLKRMLREIGFEVQVIDKPAAPPLLIATYTADPSYKTIGIYGHYDIQAEDPLHEWHTSPFTLVEEKGKYVARGIADNKGHIIQNIAAVSSLIVEKKLTNNIVFILEGEEETGSVHLEEYLEEAKQLLSSVDIFFLTDVGMQNPETPQFYYGLRGLAYFELFVTSGSRDLHSGIYGNQIINPALVVSSIVSSIKDLKSNEVALPGFYDPVREIDEGERALLAKNATSVEELIQESGARNIISMKGMEPYLVSKVYPSFDIHGLTSGYQGEGSKTIIPRSASAKFSFRLVEHQDPEQVYASVKNYIEEVMPKGVEYELKVHSLNMPFYSDFKHPLIQKAASIISKVFKNEVRYNRSGGSIPAAEILQRLFAKPIILTGFTLPDDNIHSPNENMDVSLFWKGIEVLKSLYGNL